ncbi:receptor-type tyrosine-protein phosphatase C-like [Oryzias melastigma]|uniref:receptor-type tyrosine-protein phosphatase C-like n=1 Tax=Oryzias melastigma TaxID=30732 RepID=UPI00168CBDE8|nr:receptor-type tyrosine-protein phosphatase C-like [Oryzias melastigma]
MNLSVLEPYTDYSCTGEIKNETFVFIRTPPVIFNIDCGFYIDGRSTSDNTSIQLDWTSTNRSCGVDLPKLSYICSCDTKYDKKSRVEPCVFTGLEPYRDYTCEVHPTYNNEKVNRGWKISLETDPGVPKTLQYLSLTAPENNVIDVRCDEPRKLYGPKGRYKARLHDPNGPVKEEKNSYCYFKFKDLSYSTTYRVEVTVYNGFYESPAVIGNIKTSYNDKGVVGFLILLTFLFFLFLTICLIKHRKFLRSQLCHDDEAEKMMLNSTAIYANPPRLEKP